MKTCTKCGHELPLASFSQERKRGKLVRRAECRTCQNRRTAVANRRKYERRRVVIDRLKEVPCLDCGQNFPPYMMDFDHRDRSKKALEFHSALGRAPWGRLLEEIEKCDVVCARCHRLRSWVPTKTGRKRQLLRELKARPCADCRESFHYSQMDFDHVRGVKRGALARLTGLPLKELLDEVRKCDVVCAHCHRERTRQRNQGLEISPKTIWPEFETPTWQGLVGSMNDQAVAAIAGVTVGTVSRYRMGERIPAFRSQSTTQWQHLVGTAPDSDIAKIGGVTRSAVGHYRRRVGVPAFKPARRNEHVEATV